MTQEEAVSLAESGWWKDETHETRARVQLNEDRLIMPFEVFHEAVEKALGRPVWTHEFAFRDALIAELEGDEPTPENPAQHALDSLAAMLLAKGKDPDESIIVVEGGDRKEAP